MLRLQRMLSEINWHVLEQTVSKNTFFWSHLSLFPSVLRAGLLWTSLITKPWEFSISWLSGKWSFRTDRCAVALSGNSGARRPPSCGVSELSEDFLFLQPCSLTLGKGFHLWLIQIQAHIICGSFFRDLFSCSIVSNSLQSHGLQHARPPCPSPTPRDCLNSCPSSRWCHPTISSSVVPSPPAFNLSQHQGLFQWVSSSHQVAKVGVSASASVLPTNIQVWFPLGWTIFRNSKWKTSNSSHSLQGSFSMITELISSDVGDLLL